MEQKVAIVAVVVVWSDDLVLVVAVSSFWKTKMTTLVTRRDLFSAGFEHRPLPEDSLSAQL